MSSTALRLALATGIVAGGTILGAGSAVAAADGCREVNGTIEDVTRVSGNSFTVSSGTYRYDRNDNFAFGVEGESATYAQFRKALSVGDGVQVFDYCRERAGGSGFALVEFAEPTPKCQQVNSSLDAVTRVGRSSFTTSSGTYRYDRNDKFGLGVEGGDDLTYAQFRKALSVGDDVQVFQYCNDRSGASGFALVEYADAPKPKPTPPAKPKPTAKPKPKPVATPSATPTPSGSGGSGGNGCRQVNGTIEDVTRAGATSFTTASGTYRYDSNDGFAFGVEGDDASYAQFKRALSVGDGVQVFQYCTGRAGRSGFALVEFAGTAPGPKPTASPSSNAIQHGTTADGTPVYGPKETPQGGVAAGGGGAATQGQPGQPGQQGAGSDTTMRVAGALGAGLAAAGGLLLYRRRGIES